MNPDIFKYLLKITCVDFLNDILWMKFPYLIFMYHTVDLKAGCLHCVLLPSNQGFHFLLKMSAAWWASRLARAVYKFTNTFKSFFVLYATEILGKIWNFPGSNWKNRLSWREQTQKLASYIPSPRSVSFSKPQFLLLCRGEKIIGWSWG